MYSNLNLNDKLHVILPEATHALSCFFSSKYHYLFYFVCNSHALNKNMGLHPQEVQGNHGQTIFNSPNRKMTFIYFHR